MSDWGSQCPGSSGFYDDYGDDVISLPLDGGGESITGAGGKTSIDIRCIRIGNIVTITIPSFSIPVKNTTVISTVQLPEYLRPMRDTTCLITVYFGSAYSIGTFFVSETGICMFSKLGGAPFPHGIIVCNYCVYALKNN
jgi:hypothetical protein